ncbi:hypothetical protein AAW14_24175 [Streptomyces hygroscopicus]|uniref:hypothetical protein n=1 Tax=Streptomyces hygroscopicus TaxID=1912 RepID=UPI00223FC422|nr:hypothetical protein [Streptomyces hygroscopicus]MCW7945021.1 hypothetical protein [Streptomyces hygroscopicus]
MYTMDQAERLAAEALRQEFGEWSDQVALFGKGEFAMEKGDFFYFGFQSVKYIETRDDKYFSYGPNCISVHRETGECRFLDIHEVLALGSFNNG